MARHLAHEGDDVSALQAKNRLFDNIAGGTRALFSCDSSQLLRFELPAICLALSSCDLSGTLTSGRRMLICSIAHYCVGLSDTVIFEERRRLANVAHFSIISRRRSRASPRRYAASALLAIVCANATSRNSPLNGDTSEAQSLNAERNPCVVKSCAPCDEAASTSTCSKGPCLDGGR